MAVQKEPEYLKDENGVSCFSAMSQAKHTVTGSGIFCGDTAYENFLELYTLYKTDGYGSLVHPIWGKIQAYFTELEVTMEPKANYVAYKFEFREADDEGVPLV